jgi:CCR4-NOT transcription complex subunit 6
MQELEEAQGDIVCLQEVQTDHYEQHLKPFMHERGFDSVYKQKSREGMGQYGKVDGCATFWRRSKFMMIENFNIEYNEQARKSSMGMDESDQRWFMNKLLRDNIAQVVMLEVISRTAVRLPRQSMQVCVANTHLYANHHKPDVKLWQVSFSVGSCILRIKYVGCL